MVKIFKIGDVVRVTKEIIGEDYMFIGKIGNIVGIAEFDDDCFIVDILDEEVQMMSSQLELIKRIQFYKDFLISLSK